jgi:phospholipase C
VISVYPEGSTPPSDPNLFSDLQDQGLSWRVFEEGMPSPCYQSDSGNYTATHNPATFYANIVSSCQIDDLPYSGTNLPTNSSVNLTMIVPNTCDSMQNCTISVGDRYLSQIVPKIMATSDYQNGGAIFIVWDRGNWQSDKYGTFGSPSNVVLPAFIISPLVKQGYISTAPYDHYSVLHTIEYMLGLPDMGRNDGIAPLITDIWK